VNAQISKAPNNSAYYFLQARILLTTKDLEKAEAALEKATERDQNNLNALLLLGQVQGARGSVDKALGSWEQAVRENPRDVRSYILIGILENGRGNWQKAQGAYQKALQVQPDNPLAANNLAYSMLEHGGNTDVALSLAQVAQRVMPDVAGFADTLAWAYYHKGIYGSAISLLEEAVKKAPQDPSFHYHLGMAYQKAGNLARAREHLQRALEINPKLPQADEIRRLLTEMAKG
jgi:tetratricopeptide (TPR) repeat protein